MKILHGTTERELSRATRIEVQHFLAVPELLVKRMAGSIAVIRLDVDDPCTSLCRDLP
jgi:hypothetical protein